ncbi:MAG: hypothetical protein OHM56_01840 [Spiroplasma phoeniceum]|nr:MAG: hypothetical protein OHM57_01275 [Spiroplasma phoeniceum]UZQ32726.1 MAG: hypothetical protein OHM56_01840 [Spiroplasma phoeniceum]
MKKLLTVFSAFVWYTTFEIKLMRFEMIVTKNIVYELLQKYYQTLLFEKLIMGNMKK